LKINMGWGKFLKLDKTQYKLTMLLFLICSKRLRQTVI